MTPNQRALTASISFSLLLTSGLSGQAELEDQPMLAHSLYLAAFPLPSHCFHSPFKSQLCHKLSVEASQKDGLLNFPICRTYIVPRQHPSLICAETEVTDYHSTFKSVKLWETKLTGYQLQKEARSQMNSAT